MILASTIKSKLEKVHGSLNYDFDIRYLQRWIDLYPTCFPKFVIQGNFKILFVWNKQGTDFRYELHKLTV